MKIVETREDVLVGGAQSVDTFTIRASAKAFQILSSNLYSNPLGSMIRELSTNAYDAHVMVGKKDEPFVITLPNSMEPTFKIRDFGPGLSQSEINSVYTTFFESTKTDSNDVVGCLGLGSKSPFGVADSFTITSVHGGKKTIYSAFLNDARIPSIAKFAEMDSDEENGIEIEVAISEEDFRVFNREVNTQLKYFVTKPIVKGNSDFTWNVEEEYMYQGTGWKMVRGDGSARVVQGQIQYPISVRDMGRIFDNAPRAVQELLFRNILIEVNIGDVNIAPSREALSYDDRTSQNIIAAAQKIVDELPGKIKETIQDAESEYAARLKYAEIMNPFGRGYYSRGALAQAVRDSGEILWKGKDVSDLTITLQEEDIIAATRFSKNYNGRFQKSPFHKYTRNYESQERVWEITATSLKNTIFVYSTPEDKAVEARAKQYLTETMGNNGSVIIIKTNRTVQKFANRMGMKKANLVLASDLPKVKRTTSKTRTASGKTEINVPYYRNNYGWNKSDLWDEKTVGAMTELKGLYVDLDRYDVKKPCGRMIGDVKTYINGAIELGILDKETMVYGLRKANAKKKHNLTNLFTFIEEQIKNVQVKTKVELGSSSVAAKISLRDAETMRDLVKADSPIQALFAAMIENQSNDYSQAARYLLAEMKVETESKSIADKTESLDKLYPMIVHSGYYMDASVAAEYINQMDLLRELTKDQ